LSIVIRESVDVDDVLLELLEDRLDDEDESPVVMNKDLPLKFALTSLNLIFEPLDEPSLLEQERKVRPIKEIRKMNKTFFIFILIQKSDF
jgi:hypothetical protein